MALNQLVQTHLRSVGALASRIGRLGTAPRVETLQLVPKDIRTADPSFARELAHGQMGLAGRVVDLAGQSPFKLATGDTAWTADLMAFDWLRHLAATGDVEDRVRARLLCLEFLAARPDGIAWRLDVAGRRLMTWLSHAACLIDGADERFYATFMRAVADTMDELDRRCRSGEGTPERITASAAVALAALVLDSRPAQRERAELVLVSELKSQIRADGGHVTRNAALVLELLVDLLPLRACYIASGLPPPETLVHSIENMTAFLRHMRLGDGSLARFNGTGRVDADLMATIEAVATAKPGTASEIGPSGYARLERGTSIVLVDCASPALASGMSTAGTLAFEMTVAGARLVCNGGWARGDDPGLRAMARATASHSTLTLAASSSSEPDKRIGWTSASPLSGPVNVRGALADREGGIELTCEHDGYVARHGLLHKRRLTLSVDGSRLDVEDRLAGPGGTVRLERDLPFAVHVHLDADADAATTLSGDAVTITLASGETWRLAVQGARASLEPSRDFAHVLGPVPTRQIVLRGSTAGDTTVTWSLERVAVEG